MSCNSRWDGFTTLPPSQKCRANNGSTRKKFKMVHSAGNVMASIFWASQGVIMIDYLEQGKMINDAYFAGKLRRLRQEIPRQRQNWFAVFCSCRITPLSKSTCHKLPLWLLQLNVDLKSFLIPIFSWYSSFWLLFVPKTEIPSSWYTVWKQWRVIEAVNKYLGDQEKASYFKGIIKLWQRWAKCIALKGDYIEK